MPINHPLTQHHSFGPDELTVLATTFDAAMLEARRLGGVDPVLLGSRTLMPPSSLFYSARLASRVVRGAEGVAYPACVTILLTS
jgi:hypothetical protein